MENHDRAVVSIVSCSQPSALLPVLRFYYKPIMVNHVFNIIHVNVPSGGHPDVRANWDVFYLGARRLTP